MPSVARVGPFVAFVSGWIVLGLAFSQKPEPAAPRAENAGISNAQTIGMAGCAATGCHGRPDVRHDKRDAETWHESLALWLDRDPHTRAYSVLDGALAKKIMANLGKHDETVPKDATRDARCLACHSNPSLANEAAMADRRLDRIRAEGVSCESCHGNAERWQIAHTNTISPESRTQTLKSWQMNDLNDWAVQAKTCVGCHVGAGADPNLGLPVRDMNHDMIAAGHPRLEFDFPLYQAKLATHWQPKHRGTGANPGNDAMLHAWLHGQIATDEAYCDLSLDRIARANTHRSPFPEFADWNCSQCHHRLSGEPIGWREQAVQSQTTGAGSIRNLGRPMWIGSSAFQSTQPMPKFGDKIDKQKEAIQSRKKNLEFYRLTLDKNPLPEARRLVREFLATGPTHKHSWEEATRVYIGLRSLDACLHTDGNQSAKDLRVALWDSSDEPSRKEHAAKDYHRKPESRWNWEAMPSKRPDTFEATARKYRDELAADLQKLPPIPTKP